MRRRTSRARDAFRARDAAAWVKLLLGLIGFAALLYLAEGLFAGGEFRATLLELVVAAALVGAALLLNLFLFRTLWRKHG